MGEVTASAECQAVNDIGVHILVTGACLFCGAKPIAKDDPSPTDDDQRGRRVMAEKTAEEREHIRAIADEWCQVCGEDWPCRGSIDDEIRAAVAAQKERDAEENARLREALDKLARLGNEPEYGNSIGNQIARTALSEDPPEVSDG